MVGGECRDHDDDCGDDYDDIDGDDDDDDNDDNDGEDEDDYDDDDIVDDPDADAAGVDGKKINRMLMTGPRSGSPLTRPSSTFSVYALFVSRLIHAHTMPNRRGVARRLEARRATSLIACIQTRTPFLSAVLLIVASSISRSTVLRAPSVAAGTTRCLIGQGLVTLSPSDGGSRLASHGDYALEDSMVEAGRSSKTREVMLGLTLTWSSTGGRRSRHSSACAIRSTTLNRTSANSGHPVPSVRLVCRVRTGGKGPCRQPQAARHQAMTHGLESRYVMIHRE
jgi:hypothetical protein